jgi:hypothetical protein
MAAGALFALAFGIFGVVDLRLPEAFMVPLISGIAILGWKFCKGLVSRKTALDSGFTSERRRLRVALLVVRLAFTTGIGVLALVYALTPEVEPVTVGALVAFGPLIMAFCRIWARRRTIRGKISFLPWTVGTVALVVVSPWTGFDLLAWAAALVAGACVWHLLVCFGQIHEAGGSVLTATGIANVLAAVLLLGTSLGACNSGLPMLGDLFSEQCGGGSGLTLARLWTPALAGLVLAVSTILLSAAAPLMRTRNLGLFFALLGPAAVWAGTVVDGTGIAGSSQLVWQIAIGCVPVACVADRLLSPPDPSNADNKALKELGFVTFTVSDEPDEADGDGGRA